MKKLLSVALFLFAASGPAWALDEVSSTPPADDNAAMDFALTSAALAEASRSDRAVAFSSAASRKPSIEALGSSGALGAMPSLDNFAADTAAEPAAPAAPRSSSPYNYSKRAYRWQLGLGAALVRFRSSVYYATAAGLNSSLSYYVKDWLAVDAAVTSAFSGNIFANERVKYVGYGVGPKFSLEEDKFEPWVHVLVGGIHIVPQTALGGQSGFEFQVGGGADYLIFPRVGVRLEGDWLRSHAFGQWQNSGQVVLGGFFNF